MFSRETRTVLGLLLIVAIVAACGDAPRSPSTASPSILPSTATDAGASPSVSAVTPKPSLQARPTPSPRERLARWSTKPHRIFSRACMPVAATIDGASRFHVAAACGQRIWYATSPNGRSWKTSALAPPADRIDMAPQLAVDGTTLYIAVTRLAPVEPDTCGGEVPVNSVGIYYRSRALPNGSWSAATRIGHVGDLLQSFRVIDDVIHATVVADGGGGPVSYESQKGSTFRELRIPGASATALRIGDDGRPRIAYTTGHALRFAVVTGGDLATTTVFSADDVLVDSPVLVLGSGDHAFVSWAATEVVDSSEGCSGEVPPPPSHEGTWFATDVDGKWATKRLSKDIGAASLAIDVASGRLHATYNDRRGIRYVTRAADGTWSGSRLHVSADFSGAVLRRDPATGLLLLVGPMWGEDEANTGIYALTAS